MADSILGLIAQGPQQSPIQGYLKGRELKAQREERASMEKSRALQRQKLNQALTAGNRQRDAQEFFLTTASAVGLNDEKQKRQLVERMAFEEGSLFNKLQKGLLAEENLDKALFESIQVGQAAGFLEAPRTATNLPTPTDIDDFVERANQQSILTKGRPLSPGEKNTAALQFKRAQAAEVGATTKAKKAVELDFAGAIKRAEKTGNMLAEISNVGQLIEAKGEITPVQKKENASKRISGVLADIAANYNKLDKRNAIINTERDVVSNVSASLGSSRPGQFLQNIVGTEEQSIRNQIKNAQPLLINYIRQASEMGARGLDSEKELQFYLQAATDPSRDVQSNIAALAVLDEAYGQGQLSAAFGRDLSAEAVQALKNQGRRIREQDLKDTGEDTKPKIKFLGFE